MSKEHPIRIQRSRQHKQVSPNGLPIVYVGRVNDGALNTGEFGNPFKIGEYYRIAPKNDKRFVGMSYVHCLRAEAADSSFTKVEDNAHAVEMFKEYIEKFPLRKEQLEKLKGKNLSCWCKIGDPCHADILLKIANQ